jgi:hypothetical protein
MNQPICCGRGMTRLCKEYMATKNGMIMCLGIKYWCEECGREELR